MNRTVDVKLLKRQQRVLLALLRSKKISKRKCEAIDGIINLIDDMTDNLESAGQRVIYFRKN
jgi:hypothetical protein